MSDSTTLENGNNALKRKNEDLNNDAEETENNSVSNNKRVALDSEQLEKEEASNAVIAPKVEIFGKDKQSDEEQKEEQNEANDEQKHEKEEHEDNEQHAGNENEDAESKANADEEPAKEYNEEPKKVSQDDVEKFLEEAALLTKLSQAPSEPQSQPQPQPQPQSEEPTHTSKPISSHKENESDPSFVSFRMYCPVKEASTIVGKQGAKINHLREKANVKIQISDNLKGVPERIITIKGTAENVAKAFGLVVRTILGEDEDTPANMNSQQYNLKLLVPNAIIGYVIGKQGLKFREIEENSAAKLKAAEQTLPFSTDRVLSVLGVADAIHIAVYFIAEVVIEHKDILKKSKIVLYNPANHQHEENHFGGQQSQQQLQQPRFNMQQPGLPPNQFGSPIGYQKPFQPDGPQPQQPYNFSMMFQPSVQPQQQYGMPQQMAPPPLSQGVPPQNQYTDEYNNKMIGDVIIKEPVLAGDKYNQDVFVANSSIGSVIGKGGNNIKHIRESSGCSYVKIEPDRGQSIMLGGGRGLTNIRRLTLTGSLESFQKAIYLINQRINADRERNSR
ncbi:PBP2 [Candida margitis]|uniref:PBP2 n=1 Tax=Candida margitis TaxID=1775924 RepID=UPI002227549E|nr:PBP2 [Candida margitis]KAI5957882.1 PBP2 [Candida margitis]